LRFPEAPRRPGVVREGSIRENRKGLLPEFG
jgi:hypothetical protein